MWGIELKRNREIPLARQIYQALRTRMTAGSLQPGDVLPATRELARQLAVSRNTVYEAYEMLTAEGYIVSRPGSQTRVAAGLQLAEPLLAAECVPETHQLLHCAADFRTGRPELRRFPRHLWLQLIHRAAEQAPLEQWGYTGPEGLSALREEIAAWLLRSRGLTVQPQAVYITAGATQALHLLAELLAGQGQEMLVEDPCHTGMLRVLERQGMRIRPVPVDHRGLQTEYLEGREACAAYITPSHQFPLGGILPASRRADLIRFARENGLYLIEDDYDSEFRYSGPPVAPLYAMDPARVIYVGTFSKILFPALRIGYVLLPPELRDRWCRLRTYADVQNPPFEQAALAEYLHSRKLDRHVQQMRRLYGQRRQFLLQTLTGLFGDTWRAWGDAAGLHLALEFPGRRFDREFARTCRESGILITPVEKHSIIKGRHLEKLLLGYGHLDTAEISAGIQLLYDHMHRPR